MPSLSKEAQSKVIYRAYKPSLEGQMYPSSCSDRIGERYGPVTSLSRENSHIMNKV